MIRAACPSSWSRRSDDREMNGSRMPDSSGFRDAYTVVGPRDPVCGLNGVGSQFRPSRRVLDDDDADAAARDPGLFRRSTPIPKLEVVKDIADARHADRRASSVAWAPWDTSTRAMGLKTVKDTASAGQDANQSEDDPGCDGHAEVCSSSRSTSRHITVKGSWTGRGGAYGGRNVNAASPTPSQGASWTASASSRLELPYGRWSRLHKQADDVAKPAE